MTDPPREDTLLPAADLLDDLVFLHGLLQKQYAGYPDLLQHRDFDPPAFFAGWADRLGGAGCTVTFADAVIAPLVALRRVLPDNHLTFRGADAALAREPSLTVHEYQAPLAADAPADSCSPLDASDVRPSTLRTAPRLRSDGTVDLVLTASASGAEASVWVWCGDRAIELQRRPTVPAPAARPPRVPAYEWREVGDTSVITLRHFALGPAAVRDQLRRLAEDYALHAARPRVLFDLRGNGGGSLEYLTAWIAQARSGEWQSYARLEIDGALWPCSAWNALVEQQIRDGVVDTAAAREERERLRAAWPPRPPTRTQRLVDPGLRRGRAAHPYGGRVFVLVDRHSGSSGELAAVELKRALGATLIGERTSGAMQYAQVRRLVLPRTGLVCQVATRRFFFGDLDGDLESVGWPVDIYLEDTAQDAAVIATRLEALPAAEAQPSLGVAPAHR
jgi:hypothetical protein